MAHACARRNVRSVPKSNRPSEAGEPDLFTEVSVAMADPEPLHLLSYVSSLVAAVDPRTNHGLSPSDRAGEVPRLDELAAAFIEVDTPETTALLAVIAVLAGDDEMLRARIRRALAARTPAEPAWLTRLSDPVTHRAVRMGHALGDGDNIMLGVRLAGRYELTFVVYIDHNLGTLVKDAFVVPDPIEQMVDEYRRIADDPDVLWDELSLADARACLQQAIDLAAITFPPLETESWPASRPLIEWVIRDLPGDGAGYQRPQWELHALSGIAERFFASKWGVGLDDAEHRAMLEPLLRFGADHGVGDPLVWSTVRVEMLFGDWLPRKVTAPADLLARIPDLLRAFVRFAHAEAGLRADPTEDTLAAIDLCEPQLTERIGAPGAHRSASLLAALGLTGSGVDVEELLLENFAQEVGGIDQLNRLDAAPLPDEPFEWTGIAEDVTARVAEVLDLVDGCCAELLDTEYRTACRRLLARIAIGDPTVFRRAGRAETAAAAVVWIIGKANGLFDGWADGLQLQVRDVMNHFGLGNRSVSQRAGALLRAAGLPDDTHVVSLDAPEFLISEQRQALVLQRDENPAAARPGPLSADGKPKIREQRAVEQRTASTPVSVAAPNLPTPREALDRNFPPLAPDQHLNPAVGNSATQGPQ